jgi:Enoyl-CoA hydratase/isomerase
MLVVKGRGIWQSELRKDGPVWTVIHDRPEARNAMDPESADALTAVFLEFDADKEASVAVFYGAGGAFCAGWDLKYVSTLDADYPLGELDISTARPRGNGGEIPRGPLGPSRLELDKPVIAAVEGPAVAGGMELALWCDFRVMAKESYFGVYCRRWGVPLIDGGTVRRRESSARVERCRSFSPGERCRRRSACRSACANISCPREGRVRKRRSWRMTSHGSRRFACVPIDAPPSAVMDSACARR